MKEEDIKTRIDLKNNMTIFNLFTKRREVIDLINEIPIKTLKENVRMVENSLKIIRVVKHRIGWGHTLHSNDIAINLMNPADLEKFLSLKEQILTTLTMIALILTNDSRSKVYKLAPELISYLTSAKFSLEKDLTILLERIPEKRAA